MKKLIFLSLTLSFLSVFPVRAHAQSSISVSFSVGDTRLTLRGKASPQSQVTFVENGSVIGTTSSAEDGDFTKTFTSQDAGIHSIQIHYTDENGDGSSTVTVSVSLIAFNETTLSNIILPPTINLEKERLNKGAVLKVYGTSVPNSTVTLFFFNSKKSKSAESNESGDWSIEFDTSSLEEGSHEVYSKVTTSGGSQSERSKTREFKLFSVTKDAIEAEGEVGKLKSLCPLPNFWSFFDKDKNCNVSFEEFLVGMRSWVINWRKSDEECDLNDDNKCNLADFSIMLYYVKRDL